MIEILFQEQKSRLYRQNPDWENALRSVKFTIQGKQNKKFCPFLVCDCISLKVFYGVTKAKIKKIF